MNNDLAKFFRKSWNKILRHPSQAAELGGGGKDYDFQGVGYHVFLFPNDVTTDIGEPDGLNPYFQREFVLAPSLAAAESYWNGDSSGITEAAPIFDIRGSTTSLVVAMDSYTTEYLHLYGAVGILGPTYTGQPFGEGAVGDF